MPAVFDWLAAEGNIDNAEMRRTFNCGVGFCVIVREQDAGRAVAQLNESGEQAWRLGTIEPGDGGVVYD